MFYLKAYFNHIKLICKVNGGNVQFLVFKKDFSKFRIFFIFMEIFCAHEAFSYLWDFSILMEAFHGHETLPCL